MKETYSWKREEYTLRTARAEDAERYYTENFNPLDPEVARLTGCKPSFTQQEVTEFFLQCVEDETRFDFLLVAPDGRVVGESVVNEIDKETRSANFRICIFSAAARGQGLGLWMVRVTRDFAFEQLGLHRLSLDVFSFNPRAAAVYEKAGFRCEGVLRDAVRDGAAYGDDILMSILENEWQEMKAADL